MKMQLFRNDVNFSLLYVSVTGNYKQSISLIFITVNVLLTLF